MITQLSHPAGKLEKILAILFISTTTRQDTMRISVSNPGMNQTPQKTTSVLIADLLLERSGIILTFVGI